MKLDDELRLSILEKVGVYSNRFSITVPKVLFPTSELLAELKEVTHCTRTTAY